MSRTSRSTVSGLITGAAAAALACADGAAREPQRSAADAGAELPCPTVAEVETAIGFPVQSRPVPADGCVYEIMGRHRGAMITLMYQPATRADDVFAEIKEDVKVKGANAQADRLSLGDGGWGYSSRGKQEAAVVSQDRLYYVEIGWAFFQSLKLRDDAALRVLELGMRTAPGTRTVPSTGTAGTTPATRDACTLASNAEVAQVAEEKPQLAKFWSAPITSHGGAHCDYDGGSIRIYRSGADLESALKSLKADKAERRPVAGIGDKAFFMIPYPDDEYKRLALLAVYAGSQVLQLTLDANGDEPVEATRPRLERFARLVLPRLR